MPCATLLRTHRWSRPNGRIGAGMGIGNVLSGSLAGMTQGQGQSQTQPTAPASDAGVPDVIPPLKLLVS
jgi:hypothetical protein